MEVSLFKFNTDSIRVLTDAAGEPWFIALDVCRVLDVANSRDAIASLDEADVGTTDIRSENVNGVVQSRTANTVNESGLYQLIFASRKPEAKVFKRWVTKEVIPAIRKTGSYSLTTAPVLPEITFPEALRLLADAEEKKAALLIENAELKPKAEFFDAVTASSDTFGWNETAKLLDMGRNRMLKKLRGLGILMSGKERHNTPYQRYIDEGYFSVTEGHWTDPKDGTTHLTLTTRAFQRGVDFIRRKLSPAV